MKPEKLCRVDTILARFDSHSHRQEFVPRMAADAVRDTALVWRLLPVLTHFSLTASAVFRQKAFVDCWVRFGCLDRQD